MDDKIVKVVFEEGWDTQFNESLTRGDYGQTLQIEGLTLPDGNVEVHFSLTEYDGEAPVSIGTVKDNVITVAIPDFILQKENVTNSAYCAWAWIYVTDGESGQTIRKIEFTIESRPKATTNVPEDQKDQFLEEVRQVMTETKEIAQSVRDDADNGEFDGPQGPSGKDGKSAYQYAVEGGYSKTEEEFMEGLARAGDVITKSEHEAELLKAFVKVTTEEAPFHHITDSANMKVLDFGMEGKTEQETTEGKNLFDVSKLELTSATNIGITEVGKDYITITSYDGYTGNGLISSGKTLRELCPALEVGETYILTATTESSTMSRIYVGVAWNFGKTAVITEDMLNATVLFCGHGYSNAIGPCKISNIQIELGSVATEYEPFTNGPSPNPDYPQDIELAGVLNEETGRYEIGCEVVNKNWYSGGDISGTQNVKPESMDIIPAGTYTLSANVESSDTDNTHSLVICKYVNGGNIGTHLTRGNGQSQKVTFADDVYTMVFYAANNNGISADDTFSFTDIQIELGDTATTHVPHASQPFTLTSPVPLTKWDKLVKRDGVWGWSILSGRTDDLASLFSNGVIYGSAGAKYMSGSVMPNVYLKYNKENFYSEAGCQSANGSTLYQPKIYNDNIIVAVTDDDTVETAKEHLHYKAIWRTSTEQAFIPLPDEEQELLNNLETYYGVTNMYNDQGCPMWLTYVADPKLYVDQKLLEIQQAII